jgi:hypothetical protein
LDFIVTRGIPATNVHVVPVFELSSDHSPIFAKIGASLINIAITPTLATTHTNWDMFRAYIDKYINLRSRIEECAELDEATQYFTTLIQAAARMGEDRGVHRVLVAKLEGKRPLGRPRRRWENNIKMDLQEVGGGRGDWMELAQDRERWRALVGTVRDFWVP